MPPIGELEGSFDLAHGRLYMEGEEVRFLRLSGAELALINGELIRGDSERRDWSGFPVVLRPGWNTIWVLGIDGGFELDLWKPRTRMVLGTWAPNVETRSERLDDADATLFLPLFNASTRAADGVHFHYYRAYSEDSDPFREINWADGAWCEPLAMVSNRSYLFDWKEPVPAGDTVYATVEVYASQDSLTDTRDIPLRTAEPLPSWPDAERESIWPALRGEPGAPVYFVHHSRVGDGTALAAARFCQQDLWYRTGVLAAVVPAAWLESKRGKGMLKRPIRLLHLGYHDEVAPGEYNVELIPSNDEDRFEAWLWAGDRAGMLSMELEPPYFGELKGR